jgi:hypothetical protein
MPLVVQVEAQRELAVVLAVEVVRVIGRQAEVAQEDIQEMVALDSLPPLKALRALQAQAAVVVLVNQAFLLVKVVVELVFLAQAQMVQQMAAGAAAEQMAQPLVQERMEVVVAVLLRVALLVLEVLV